jgi:hypothetical protein
MEKFSLDSFFGGAPSQDIQDILKKIPCKTPMLTYLLSAIFILNIFVIVYTMYTEYGKGGEIGPEGVRMGDIKSISFSLHGPTLIYYIIVLGITIKYHCSPMTSLLYHPVLFVTTFGYLLMIGLTGLSNLYFLSQTDESNNLQNIFTEIASWTKNKTGKVFVSDNENGLTGNFMNVAAEAAGVSGQNDDDSNEDFSSGPLMAGDAWAGK